MGAWSYEVMTNDAALDEIDLFVSSKDLKNLLKNYLHEEHYLSELLLAVEIVDISINGIDIDILGGFYEYKDWFEKLSNNPMIELKEDAIHAIKYIINEENKYGSWVEDVKKERKNLLIKIQNRLEGKTQINTKINSKKEMSTVEIVQWLMSGCFDERFANIMQSESFKDIYELFDKFSAEDLINKIEEYEGKKQNSIEQNVEDEIEL